MSVRFRIAISEELNERLETHLAETLRTREGVAEAAISEYLAAMARIGQAAVPIGTDDCPKRDTEPQVVEPPPVKDPLKGAKPHDTDEILALIRAVNELPASTELSGDMMFVNAERRADIHRQIARLRTAVEASRLQVAQNQ